MKLFFLLFVLIHQAFLVHSGENYNYYIRNIDGSFIISNIEENWGIKYFRYTLINENDETKIIGYYYNTNIIKFIDIINNNQIKSTKYFDINNNIIYQREYFYDDKKLSSLIIFCISNNFSFHSEIKIEYARELIRTNSYRLIKNTSATINNISLQFFDNNYMPMYNEALNILRHNDLTQIVRLKEINNYINGKMYLHEIFENDVKVFIKEYHYEEEIIRVEEKRFNEEILIYSKTTYIDDMAVKEKNFTFPDLKFETEYQIDEIATGLFFKQTDSSSTLICEDEIVTIEKENLNFFPVNKYILLRIKLDPFFDTPILNTYYSEIMPHPLQNSWRETENAEVTDPKFKEERQLQ